MRNLRPADLAREHGISTQAVRNYERDGCVPAAGRTASGYRIYTELHAQALRAYLALIRAFGHAAAGQIMNAVHRGMTEDALVAIDRGHHQLLRDRNTLHAVRSAVEHLTAVPDEEPDDPVSPGRCSIGDLAHRLDMTPATLRTWESAGILQPERDPATGYRAYGPEDIRDAELTHLLRRGGYLLDHIAGVVRQIRTAGGTDRLSAALEGWQRKLTDRGIAMLTASARLSRYLDDLPAALKVSPY